MIHPDNGLKYMADRRIFLMNGRSDRKQVPRVSYLCHQQCVEKFDLYENNAAEILQAQK